VSGTPRSIAPSIVRPRQAPDLPERRRVEGLSALERHRHDLVAAEALLARLVVRPRLGAAVEHAVGGGIHAQARDAGDRHQQDHRPREEDPQWMVDRHAHEPARQATPS
jgi:hypothetical protein